MTLAGKTGRWLFIGFVLVWTLGPIYWALNTSLMTTAAAQERPARLLTSQPYTGNYGTLFGKPTPGLGDVQYAFQKSLLNSSIEAMATTIITTVIAVFSAYAFARLRFRLKRTILYVVLFTLVLPAYATLIPLYRMLSGAGLANTYTGVVLVSVSGFLPLVMWVMYNYFVSLPSDLEEAALVDGATTLQVLARIVLPLAVPGIMSAAGLTFLLTWAQFLFPLVLTSDLHSEPVTVVVAALFGQRVIPFTLLNAAGVVAIAIPGLLALALNRFIIQGLLGGSSR